MGNSQITFDLEARVADLERRFQKIAPGAPDRHPEFLLALYHSALRGPQNADAETVGLWSVLVLALGVKDLLVMARGLNDPMPWRPFLRNLDIYIDEGIEVEPVREHILTLAEALLRIQGLDLLHPRDVMGHPMPDIRTFSPSIPISR